MPALRHLLRRFLGLEGARRAVVLTQSLEPASSTYPGDWTGPVAPYGPLEDGIDVGSGAWDRQRRRSEARVDRIVRLDPSTVRRESGLVYEGVYEAVVTAVDAVRRGVAYDDDPV